MLQPLVLEGIDMTAAKRCPGSREQRNIYGVAVFPKGNALMVIRDELGAIYVDEAFTRVFPIVASLPRHPGGMPL